MIPPCSSHHPNVLSERLPSANSGTDPVQKKSTLCADGTYDIVTTLLRSEGGGAYVSGGEVVYEWLVDYGARLELTGAEI